MAAIRFRFVIKDQEAVLALIEAREQVERLLEEYPWLSEPIQELSDYLERASRAVSIEEDTSGD